MNELQALVALSTLPHLGSVKIRLLIQYFGSALAAWKADPNEIAHWPGFGKKILDSLQRRDSSLWQKEIELAAKHQAQIIPYTSPQYPKRLLELPDHPIILYVKGTLKQEDQQSIAVVGTRHMSIYGGETAKKISHDLAGYGFTVVSGLARGIDTAAHQGALERGRTLAVIGSGLADIYPRENIPLSQAIIQRGALISEFAMLTPPDRQTFPQRNRIVSGMSMGTLLIEAPISSGAMITMHKAFGQKRKMFAIPGRTDAESFRGNHLLIKKGMAQLVENAQDVIQNYQDFFSNADISISTRRVAAIPLEKEEEHLLNQLPADEISLESIVQRTNVPIMKLNVLLMSLILKKCVKEFPGKIYKKNV